MEVAFPQYCDSGGIEERLQASGGCAALPAPNSSAVPTVPCSLAFNTVGIKAQSGNMAGPGRKLIVLNTIPRPKNDRLGDGPFMRTMKMRPSNLETAERFIPRFAYLVGADELTDDSPL
jgi:hypothetical protein